jgi:hypothetical protein
VRDVLAGAVELAAIVLAPDVAILADHLAPSRDAATGGAAGQLAPAQELVDRGSEVFAAATVLSPFAVARAVDQVEDAGLADRAGEPMAVALEDLDTLGDGALVGADPGVEGEGAVSNGEAVDCGLRLNYHRVDPFWVPVE